MRSIWNYHTDEEAIHAMGGLSKIVRVEAIRGKSRRGNSIKIEYKDGCFGSMGINKSFSGARHLAARVNGKLWWYNFFLNG